MFSTISSCIPHQKNHNVSVAEEKPRFIHWGAKFLDIAFAAGLFTGGMLLLLNVVSLPFPQVYAVGIAWSATAIGGFVLIDGGMGIIAYVGNAVISKVFCRDSSSPIF